MSLEHGGTSRDKERAKLEAALKRMTDVEWDSLQHPDVQFRLENIVREVLRPSVDEFVEAAGSVGADEMEAWSFGWLTTVSLAAQTLTNAMDRVSSLAEARSSSGQLRDYQKRAADAVVSAAQGVAQVSELLKHSRKLHQGGDFSQLLSDGVALKQDLEDRKNSIAETEEQARVALAAARGAAGQAAVNKQTTAFRTQADAHGRSARYWAIAATSLAVGKRSTTRVLA